MFADRSFAVEVVQASADERDRWRRKLAIRAEVHTGLAHPAVIKRIQNADVVAAMPAWRPLADLAGVPVGASTDLVDLYALDVARCLAVGPRPKP